MPEPAPPTILVDDGTTVQRVRLLGRAGPVLTVAPAPAVAPGAALHLMPAPDLDGPLLGLQASLLDIDAAGRARLALRGLASADLALVDRWRTAAPG